MPELNDLDRFDEGLPVNPMPASEVRRRGDRMRRRNTVLATVGGVAAAAVFIGLTVAVVASQGGDGDDTRPVGPPSTSATGSENAEWLNEVPEDFPLTEGMPEKNADGTPVVAGDEYFAGAGFCLEPKPWLNTVDQLGAHYRGESEDSETRSIYVFGDASAAAAALDSTEAEFEECGTLDMGDGNTLVRTEVEVDLGTEESLAYSSQWEEADGVISELKVLVIGRTGNAVYVDSSSGAAGGDSVIAYEVNRLRENSAAPLEAMCVFAAEPCKVTSTQATAPAPDPPSSSPASDALADFPLDLGYPETNEDGSDVEVTTEPGMDLVELCDNIMWDPYGDSTARIGVEYAGPEDFRGRTLAVYRYQDEAAEAVGRVEPWFEHCPEEASDAESGASNVYEPFDVDLGDESVGWTQRYRTPDGFTTGLTVYLLVRVGDAVYASFEAGEGGSSQDSINLAVLSAIDQSRPIVEAMEDL